MLDSLYRGYPSGAILVWGSAEEAPSRDLAVTQRQASFGSQKLLLDGQQRLLADPHWVKVSDVFNTDVTDWMLLRKLVSSPDDPLYEKYSARLQKLRKIADYQYVMHVLDRELSYEEVAEIFVRVNSLGMKLRSSDLALAQITAKWRGSLQLFEDFAEECERVWFTFDTGLLIRTLVVFATGQSRFRTVATIPLARLQESWEEAKEGLRFAVNFLRTNAGIEDESLLSSPFLVIPIAVLAVQRKFALSVEEERDLLHWLFVANATGHYSRGSSETILDADLSAILRRDASAKDLLDTVAQQFGRTRFTAADFAGRGPRNALFPTVYLALKHAGAKDWRSGLGLSLSHSGRRHVIQAHHIFPKGAMKDVPSSDVNEIANLAFIAGGQNRSLGMKTPDNYLPDIVAKRGEDALRCQGIPLNQSLWQKSRFGEFLEYRRAELARIVNEFLDEVASGQKVASVDALGLIARGEGPAVEFKETARFNVRTGQTDKALEAVIGKTVAGFLNADGGTLLIGVSDAGLAVGIDRDLATLSKPTRDGFELFLRNLLNTSVGADVAARMGIIFEDIEGVTVCAVTVPAASKPVWIKTGADQSFYVRSGNSTQPLVGEQVHRYVGERFP